MIAHIRWQALLTFLGIVLVFVLLGYLAFNFTIVTVPAEGGTYIEGLVGAPRCINPVLCQRNQVDADLAALIFNGLTRVDERGEILNDLAERHEISEDGQVYTFYLRRDVRWHDGAPFTAEDVLFTVQALQDSDFQGLPHLAELWRSVKVEKVDDYTIRFTLEQPFTPFLDYTTIGLMPAHLLRDVPARLLPGNRFCLEPVGTGPFQLEEIGPEKAILTSNPRFHGPRPYIKHLEFKFYPDEESVLRAYDEEEIEGWGSLAVSGTNCLRLEKLGINSMERARLFSAPLSGYVIVLLNLDSPLFEEKTVRQALLYALDRHRIIDGTLHGQGLVAHSPILPNSWAYSPLIRHYEFDPERARALLDEAGWRDEDGDGVREKEGQKLEFALLADDEKTSVQIIEEIAREWAQVGVKANPQVAGLDGLVRDFLYPRRFEAALVEWRVPPDPDPYSLWHSTQIPPQSEEGQNYAGFSHREADELMEEGRRILDRTKRIELYRRFQEIFAEQTPSLLIYYPIYNYVVDSRVIGVQIGFLFNPADRFRNLSQWYILSTRKIIPKRS
ncbi:MAG: ABC transporter substrate-binding protein [Anaerolineae bacterium]